MVHICILWTWVQSTAITTRVQNYLQNLVVERFNNEKLAVPAMIATYWVPKLLYKARYTTLKSTLELNHPLLARDHRHSHNPLSPSLHLSIISSSMELESVLQFFENKTILVTGATGFLAKGSLSVH